MQYIEKSAFLNLVNKEISKLPNYDPSIKIIDISVNANGHIDYFLSSNPDKLFLALEYMETIDPIFQGKYNRLI